MAAIFLPTQNHGILKAYLEANYCRFMPQKSVTIYSTPTCHFCKQAKEFFTEKGIQYTNYDVSVDTAKRAEMIKLTGQLGVPVIVIGGEVVIGFSRGKVAEKLGIEA
jgi:glutaredoxin 3